MPSLNVQYVGRERLGMIHSRPGYTSIRHYGGFKYFSDIPRDAPPVQWTESM